MANAGSGFVGVGGAGIPDYEGSEDYEAIPAAFAKYQYDSGRYVSLGGTKGSGRAGRLSLDVISDATSKMWEFGPILQFRRGRDDVDNDAVDKMRDIDDAWELGGFVGLKNGPWDAQFTVVTDVSDTHDGTLYELKGGYTWTINSRWRTNLGIATTYADDDYMNKYFGVKTADAARSGLPRFNADGDFKDVGASLFVHYTPGPTWGLAIFTKYNALLNDAEDSPLVDKEGDSNQWVFGAGVTYRF
jgi:outer membrane scaffolding protein for murein synthesis (MipA/OmpV family)